MDKPSSVNMQHSDDYIAKMNEKNKSFFERIYDEAINRISSGDTRPRGDAQSSGTRYIELKQDDMQQFQAPDFPVVTVEFPAEKGLWFRLRNIFRTFPLRLKFCRTAPAKHQ